MKRYYCIYSLWIAVFVLSVTASYCKPHTYSWGKGTIQISAEGTLEEPGMNDAQNNILVKEATRKAGYRTLERFLSALPLDSTRNIGDMVKSNPEFAKQLRQWLIVHAELTHFQFTSETTGSVKIAINGENFARFVAKYDIPIVVSKPVVTIVKPTPAPTPTPKKTLATDTSKTQKTLVTDASKREKNISVDTSNIAKKVSTDTTKVEKSVTLDTTKTTKPIAVDTSVGLGKNLLPPPAPTPKTQPNTVSANSTVTSPSPQQPNPMRVRNRPETGRMMPPGVRNMIQVDVQMDVAKDTTIPESVRISQAEAGIRNMAKEDLYRQIKDTQVYGEVTYTQWVHSHPKYENTLKTAIDTNTLMGVPQWNKDSTLVKLGGRLETRYLLMAVRQAEHKIESENLKPMSRDTTTLKPLPAPAAKK